MSGVLDSEQRVGLRRARRTVREFCFINYGVPQKAQAQESIASGDIIWVEGYVRSNGTQVCGYFRRK